MDNKYLLLAGGIITGLVLGALGMRLYGQKNIEPVERIVYRDKIAEWPIFTSPDGATSTPIQNDQLTREVVAHYEKPNIVTYTNQEYGFTIFYDGNIWSSINGPTITDERITLSFRLVPLDPNDSASMFLVARHCQEIDCKDIINLKRENTYWNSIPQDLKESEIRKTGGALYARNKKTIYVISGIGTSSIIFNKNFVALTEDFFKGFSFFE